MPARFITWLFCLMLLVLPGFLSGCGGGRPAMPTTYSVSGTVLMDGQPLEAGSIVFDPADGTGQPAAGAIVKGEFTLQSTPGTKTVRINSNKETDRKDEYGSLISVELVSDEFHRNSTVQYTVKSESNTGAKFEVRAAINK